MRAQIRATLVVALVLILSLEAGLRLFGARLGEPQFWYAPQAQELIGEMDRLKEAGVTSDVVFAGSSMVEFGIRPSIVERRLDSIDWAHNAGIPQGYTTVTRRWLLEEVLPRLHPTRVVWGLSSIDFNGGRPTPAIVRYERARAGAPGFFGALDRDLWSVSAIARFRDLLREPSTFLDLFEAAPDTGSQQALKDLMEPVVWPQVEQNARTLGDLTTSLLADFHIGAPHVAALEETAAALTEQGIELVLVLLPVSQPYIDAHPGGAAGYDAFVEWITGEAVRLSVPLFDHGRAVPEDEFLDYNHISPDAATTLTELVSDDLESLGW